MELAWSLVFSKLLYNVHTWHSFKGQHRDILNKVYSLVWRRVASRPRFDATALSDEAVRAELKVPSIDCHVRQRRLLYLSRIIHSTVTPLKALLTFISPRGELMPWTKLVVADLALVKAAVPASLENVADVTCDVHAFWQLISDYPREWKLILKKYYTTADDIVSPVNASLSAQVPLPCGAPNNSGGTSTRDAGNASVDGLHQGMVCDAPAFTTAKAFRQHARIKHGQTSAIARSRRNITVCCICKSEFHTRLRLVAHLSDHRIRSKLRGTNCHHEFLKIPGAILSEGTALSPALRQQQNAALTVARAGGHSRVLAKRAAIKGRPNILHGFVPKPYHMRNRISSKTSPADLRLRYPSANTLKIAPINPHLTPSSFFFGKDPHQGGCSSIVRPSSSFAAPLAKRRRIIGKSRSTTDQVSYM